MTIRVLDNFTLDGQDLRRTSDGFLVTRPRVARVGVQRYLGRELGRPEMEEVRIYRPADEVFSSDSLHSYAHRPVTVNHPPEQVRARNWKKYAVGQTGDEITRDGHTVRVPMVVMDADAIAAIEAGHRELSLGYTCEIDWKSGVTDDGEKYDGVQRDIRANHLAIVGAARGGRELRIGDADEDEDEDEDDDVEVVEVEEEYDEDEEDDEEKREARDADPYDENLRDPYDVRDGNDRHWPAGTEGGRGGQFAPKGRGVDLGGGGGEGEGGGKGDDEDDERNRDAGGGKKLFDPKGDWSEGGLKFDPKGEWGPEDEPDSKKSDPKTEKRRREKLERGSKERRQEAPRSAPRGTRPEPSRSQQREFSSESEAKGFISEQRRAWSREASNAAEQAGAWGRAKVVHTKAIARTPRTGLSRFFRRPKKEVTHRYTISRDAEIYSTDAAVLDQSAITGEDAMPMKQTVVDGIPVEMPEIAANIVSRALKALSTQLNDAREELASATTTLDGAKKAHDAKIAELTTRVATQDAEIADLKKKLGDTEITPQKLDQMVRDRATVVDKAKRVLGARLVADGKTVQEIRRQVVDAVVGEQAKGWSDDMITAAFVSMKDGSGVRGNGARDVADAFGGGSYSRHDVQDEKEKAYQENNQWLQDAYKPKSAA